MTCIQDLASPTGDCNINRSARLTITSKVECNTPTTTDDIYSEQFISPSSSATPEDKERIDFPLMNLFSFPLPSSTISNNKPPSQSPSSECSLVSFSGYDGHPSTPLTPHHDSCPEKPADQLPFAPRLDVLPTFPCFSQQNDSDCITFLMSFLGLIAMAQNQSITSLSQFENCDDNTDLNTDDVNKARECQERAERQARAANIARATTRIWTREELGVNPLETKIPIQHVRSFDGTMKEKSFLLGWGEKGEEGWKKDIRPQFTNPWNDNEIISLPPPDDDENDDREELDDGWRTGSSLGSFSSYSYRFSSPFDSIGDTSSFSSPPRSPKSRRLHNQRHRGFSNDSVDTEMSDLGMEARYSS